VLSGKLAATLGAGGEPAAAALGSAAGGGAVAVSPMVARIWLRAPSGSGRSALRKSAQAHARERWRPAEGADSEALECFDVALQDLGLGTRV